MDESTSVTSDKHTYSDPPNVLSWYSPVHAAVLKLELQARRKERERVRK
jgi:hypothetical protein